jgi:hypothetical protein
MLKQPYLVLVSGLLMVAMWVWVQAIAVPHQQAESAERGTPRGNLSDLYPRWLGARELLLRGRDPYGADITREIQIGYYGRPLDPSRPNDPKDQQAFAYPVYVVLMLAPIVRLPFALVHKILFWLFALMTAVSVPLWLRALGWRISMSAKWTWILLTLGCFPAIQGLKLQQLTVFVAALIAASASAIASRRFVWAGILLALATIKPQLVFLLIAWLCIWVIGDWRGRQRLFWSFAVSVAILVIAGELLLPGWIREFRRAMSAYYRYTGGGNSLLDVVMQPMLGKLTSAILVAFPLIFGCRYRRAAEGTREFHWSMSLALATTVVVIPMFAPYNQLLLLPGFMMLARQWRDLWQRSRLSRFFVIMTALSVFWPFVAAAVLVVTLLFLPGTTVQKAWGLPFYPSFAIPITIYALLLISKNVLADRAGPAEPRGPGLPRSVRLAAGSDGRVVC